MVRVINIDTKTKTIRISNADGDIKTWRTTESGAHFPIKEGQTTKEGLDAFLKKHVFVTGIPDTPAKKESGLLGDRYDAKHGTKPEKSKAPLLSEREVKDVTEKQPAKKERSWQRGPRESEDAYFDRREKTMAEARKIDKVSDWYKKAYAGDDAFPKNKDITFDELADGMLSGKIQDFYETVGVGESDVREKIFEELSERTGRPYDDFYNAWLDGGLKGYKSKGSAKPKNIMDWKFEDVMQLPLSDDRVIEYIAKNNGLKRSTVATIAEAFSDTESLYTAIDNISDRKGYGWDSLKD